MGSPSDQPPTTAAGRSAAQPAPAPAPAAGPATPGGLLPPSLPQFLLFTHDDAVNGKARDLLQSVLDDRQSVDGCKAHATLFAMNRNTDCKALQAMYEAGHEVAVHTVSHKRLAGEPREFVESQVLDGRRQLADCGIPESDIVGFRAPFLSVDPQLRRVLHDNGFLYDSSVVAEAPDGFGARLWPFDMGSGIPFECRNYTGDYGEHQQTCDAAEQLPGLWQVPIWQLTELGGPFRMDPGFKYIGMTQAPNASAFEILQANFLATYNGNRAPMPVFVHSFFLREGGNQRDVERFLDFALSQPNTYAVTMRQLLAYLENPVPADELSPEALGCGQPGGAGPQRPA
ncbi:polysaccharide deacetylase [Chlorella sorokiniana]|uniref:Polysaccharide deacetylase n=1 Tax=Chlorella sorokiniana TaxID=3076 RepID=A0A2P6TPI9_CHLSO|nr:polysaccharide deacetylase [Chlorella sorokiniana]|eukprot:PRW55946.1 polysaccharide deacetylase [Chlorella sorokiniana]